MNSKVSAGHPDATEVVQSGLFRAFPEIFSISTSWGVITLAAILLILPFGTFAKFPPSSIVWVTAVILFLLAFHGFMVSKLRGENPWLAPMSLLLAFYFFKYGWGALVVYYWDLFPWVTFEGIGSTFLRWGMKDHLPTATHLILLGGLGLYLGASGEMPIVSKWLPPLRWQMDDAKFQLNLALYAPIALLIFIGLRPLMPLVIRDTVLLLGSIIWVILVIVSYRFFSLRSESRLKWLVLMTFISLVHLVLGLQTGMRGNFLYPGLLILLGYIVARGYLPWRFILPAGVLLLLVVVPWLTMYKMTQKISRDELSVPKRIAAASERHAGVGFRGSLEVGLDGLLGRFAGSSAGALSAFSQYYPDPYPFDMGRTFALELGHLVPRVIWPEKPNLSFELNQYTMAVGMLPETSPDDPEMTSATFDAISEYYLNFGSVGVLLFSVLHGYFLRILYYWLVHRSHYEIGGAIYAAFFFLNLDFSGVVQLFVSATRQLLVWPVIIWILSRKA